MAMGPRFFVFVLLSAVLLHVQGEEWRQASFAVSGGVYAAGARDGVYGRLNTFRAGPDDDINERLKAAHDNGLINVVQLSHGHRWNEDREAGVAKLQAWLERTDLALIDVLHFSEEQPYNAAQWLDPLYDIVKAHDPTLPVYVWPTYPLGPMGKADGYVYDAYGEGYMKSRERFTSFLRTGKPLIMCVDASGFSDYKLAREQVMACHEMDVPVFYFAADSGSGSVNNWYGKPTRALAECRNFMFSAIAFQKRCHGENPMQAADFIWGDIIEVAPNEDGVVRFGWSEFGPATVYGFTRMGMDEESIWNERGGAMALDYQFWSLLPGKNASLTLLTDPNESAPDAVTVSASRCGRADDWEVMNGTPVEGGIRYDLGALNREQRVRLELGKGVKLSGGLLEAQSDLPEEKALDLDVYYDGWRKKILFDQEMRAGLWRALATIDRPEVLAEGEGLALRGIKGRGVRVVAVEEFRSAHPLKDIVVRLKGISEAALGGSFALGLSLDGETVLAEGTAVSEKRKDGRYDGVCLVDTRDLEAFQGVSKFYVHMIQANSSGIATNISSRIKSLEIDAHWVD